MCELWLEANCPGSWTQVVPQVPSSPSSPLKSDTVTPELLEEFDPWTTAKAVIPPGVEAVAEQ